MAESDRRDPRYARALALDAERRGSEAAALLRALLEDAPDDVDALALLGTVLAQDGFHDAALGPLERAAALRPGSAGIQNNLGKVLGGLGRGEEALAAFERSLAIRPDHPRTLANQARQLRTLGRDEEAARVQERVDALEPRSAEAWASHASPMLDRAQRSGARADVDAAIAAYRKARELGGGDPVAIDFALAALGAAAAPEAAPRLYVQRLFDSYAASFDQHLRERLHYRTPELLVAEAMRFLRPPLGDVVDLGCGTGLCGPLLRPLAARLAGVDLSAGMLEQARRRGCYDRLDRAELVEHLRASLQAYDLAVAADVVNYFGDLAPVLVAAHAALRPRGVFAFSVERFDGDGYALLPTRRYAHGAAYLRRVAAEAGFDVAALAEAVLRHDLGAPVPGTLVTLIRRNDKPADPQSNPPEEGPS